MNSKTAVLEYLKLFFDYEIQMRGRSYIFIIKAQYSEYESMFGKNKAKQIQAFYIKKTDEILDYKSRSTGTNIAREIGQTDNKYNHAIGSMENYIKPYKACKYQLKKEEQLKYLDKQFEKYLSSHKVANLIADKETGYLTKEEFCLRLDDRYLEALMQFKKKYGFRSYKAGELRKRIWIEDDSASNKNGSPSVIGAAKMSFFNIITYFYLKVKRNPKTPVGSFYNAICGIWD